ELLRQVGERRFQVELVMFGQALDHLVVVDGPAVPTTDSAACERKVRVDDYPRWVEKLLHAQAVTAGTRAGGIVEGEEARLEFRQAVTADVAGEAVGEQQFLLLFVFHEGNACNTVRYAQRRFEGFRKP